MFNSMTGSYHCKLTVKFNFKQLIQYYLFLCASNIIAFSWKEAARQSFIQLETISFFSALELLIPWRIIIQIIEIEV